LASSGNRIDDFVADVHREADRLLAVIEVGKRDRGVAITKGDRTGFLDVFQGPGQFFGIRGARGKRGGQRQANDTHMFHSYSP
jgi:hypothetical protein